MVFKVLGQGEIVERKVDPVQNPKALSMSDHVRRRRVGETVAKEKEDRLECVFIYSGYLTKQHRLRA